MRIKHSKIMREVLENNRRLVTDAERVWVARELAEWAYQRKMDAVERLTVITWQERNSLRFLVELERKDAMDAIDREYGLQV
jgi:hypothetical protein